MCGGACNLNLDHSPFMVQRSVVSLLSSCCALVVRISFSRYDICDKNLTTASSSHGARYCWLWVFSSVEHRPRHDDRG